MSPKVKETRPIQGNCYACTEYNYEWFVNDLENPYTPETPFSWIRQRFSRPQPELGAAELPDGTTGLQRPAMTGMAKTGP